MYGDRTKLREILYNLLSNACKFTDHGKIYLSVGKEKSDQIVFTVSDTGKGISHEEIKKIFLAYSQTASGRNSSVKGTGLGLMLCKRLCDLMEGRIEVRSEINEGTTFRVYLPRTHSQISKDWIPATSPILQSGNNNTVLVIDDDPQVHELMHHLLAKKGFEIVSAISGQEGLRLAKQVKPFAITLDVIMPEMAGWEVLQKIKEDPELMHIPVIIVSVVGGIPRDLPVRVDDFLTKPVNNQLLLAILSRYRASQDEKTILLVDDDATSRELMRRIVSKEGWSVIEAENGKVALEVLSKSQPQIILLDLVMPEMNGFQFIEEFKKNPAWKQIPIIILTGTALTREERENLKGSIDVILSKKEGGYLELERVMTQLKKLKEKNTSMTA
jgi:CheY-like chemotaxis protein/anti-sigma regulatory factor (Ser/Thr protein kinase)